MYHSLYSETKIEILKRTATLKTRQKQQRKKCPLIKYYNQERCPDQIIDLSTNNIMDYSQRFWLNTIKNLVLLTVTRIQVFGTEFIFNHITAFKGLIPLRLKGLLRIEEEGGFLFLFLSCRTLYLREERNSDESHLGIRAIVTRAYIARNIPR